MAQRTKGRAARAAPAVAAPGPTAQVSEVAELDQDALSGVADEIEIEARLREWAARENVEGLTVRTYVYKYENPTTGDLKVLCDRIDEEIPDPHSIGILYGAGRYMMVVSIPDGTSQQKKVKGLRFRLHPRYDELKAKAAAAGQVPVFGAAAPAPAASPQSSLKDGIEMVRVVVDMLRPLLETRSAAGPDLSQIMAGQYDMMRGVLNRSLADSQELISEVHKARLENSGGDPVDDEPDFITKIMPLLDKVLPVLLGGGAPANMTASAIRALPEFAKLAGNAHELARVIAYLDKAQGKAKTDKLLGALKVRRPGHNGRARGVAPARMAAAASG